MWLHVQKIYAEETAVTCVHLIDTLVKRERGGREGRGEEGDVTIIQENKLRVYSLPVVRFLSRGIMQMHTMHLITLHVGWEE